MLRTTLHFQQQTVCYSTPSCLTNDGTLKWGACSFSTVPHSHGSPDELPTFHAAMGMFLVKHFDLDVGCNFVLRWAIRW